MRRIENKKKIVGYAEMGKKFCQGICDREIIKGDLVCHGCKRIIIKGSDRNRNSR